MSQSSASPRAKRSSTESGEKYAKGDVRFGTDVAGENRGADKVKSSLRQEGVNERAFPTRKA
jgi:hypothetical protein